MARQTFPYISADAYVSPADKVALENLSKIPLVPQLIRKYNEVFGDRIWYAQNSAESVRCGPNQFKTVYDIMREGCSVLGVPEPEIYMRNNVAAGAFTAGMSRTFIVVQSGMVESMTDDELRFVIGHEIGHIHCAHLLFQSVGRLLMPILDMLGQATLGLGKLAGVGIIAAFYEWLRQAEYTADRAGLLVCQDKTAALSAIMKLGCGSSRLRSEMNLDEFLEQARTHSDNTGLEGAAKALLFIMYNWQLSHPQVVFRAKALDEWIKSGAYDRILGGDYTRDTTGGASHLGPQVRCPICKTFVSLSTSFCPNCGTDLRPKAAAPEVDRSVVVVCPSCGANMPGGVKFCMECGKPLSGGDTPAAASPEPPESTATPGE
jgi:Zn-dependent protease with chaperone function